MKRKLTGIFVIILLIATTLPVSGISNNIKQEKNVLDTNQDKLIIYIIGRISDFYIENKYYNFFAKSLRVLTIYSNPDGEYILQYQHYVRLHYQIGGFLSFKGILTPTFICGYFYPT